MKILLVYPNVCNDSLIGYGDLGAIAEPLALEYLGASAKLDSHEVRILDLRLHPGGLDATLRQFVPDVVGVTGYSMHVLSMLRLCASCKCLLPECVTMVGGHHATLMPEDFFEPQVDYIVCGEGVAPLRQLLRYLEKGGPVPEIPGVWSQRRGMFMSGGEPEKFSVDNLPLPDRTLTAGDRDSYFIDWMKPIALVRTSVGCPYRCNFCSLWKIMDGRYYKRDVERVVEEIALLREDCVFLVDDEAFINERRMHALAVGLKGAGVKKRYFAYCRIDTLLRQLDLMQLWRDIGLERLFIGIEAPSQKGLDEYNKKIKLVQVENGLRGARELGIQVFGGFVVNTNYTRCDFKLLRRFIEHQRIDYPSFTIFTPLPGTKFLETFDHITELQPNGRPDWDLFDLQNPVTGTLLPHEEFKKLYHDLYHVFSDKYAMHRTRVRLRDASGAFVA